jgi:hypothetical protein
MSGFNTGFTTTLSTGGGSGGGGGGGVTLAPTNPLSTWTTFDSSGGSILNSVSAQFASTTDRIDLALQNPGVASQGPSSGCGVYGPLSELTGLDEFHLNGVSLLSMFLAILRRPTSDFTDMEVFLYMYDDGGDLGSAGGTAAPTGNMKGWGIGAVYNAGEWEALVYGCTGGGSFTRDESTFNRTSQHADGIVGFGHNSRLSSRFIYNASTVAGDGFFRPSDDSGTNNVVDNIHSTSRTFNSLCIGAGWSTGVGGSAGTIPIFGSAEALHRGYRG